MIHWNTILSVLPCGVILVTLIARSSLLQPDVEGWPEGPRLVRWTLDLLAAWFGLRGAAALAGVLLVKFEFWSAWALAIASTLLLANLCRQRRVGFARSLLDIARGLTRRVETVIHRRKAG